MTDLLMRRLSEMPSSLNAALRTMEAARARIECLTKERDSLFLENGKLAVTLGAKNLKLRAVLGDLLKYLDDHDWGTIPEGATADRARAELALR